jgi:hypothetical protein
MDIRETGCGMGPSESRIRYRALGDVLAILVLWVLLSQC